MTLFVCQSDFRRFQRSWRILHAKGDSLRRRWSGQKCFSIMIISDLHPSQLSLWVWGESLSPKRRRSERVNVWCDWVQPANVSIHDAGMMCPNDQNDQQMRYPEMSSKFCLQFQAWIDVWSIVTLKPVRDHNVTRSSASVYIRTSNWSKWRLISMPYDALPESLIAWSRFMSFSEKLFFC